VEFLKPLTAEEEKRLFIQWKKEGDKEARTKLIEHNMRLVSYVAHQYFLPNMDKEDNISIGTIGLIKAVNSFDVSKNYKFATYATRCIQNEFFMYLRKMKNRVRDEVVSYELEGEDFSIYETFGTHKEEVEGKIELEEDIKILYDIIEDLNEKERSVIEYRFGINREKKRQEDIAEEFNISQSYVSRIEKKAIKKLREAYDKTVS